MEEDVEELCLGDEEAEEEVVNLTTNPSLSALNVINLDTINMSSHSGINRLITQIWMTRKRCFLWPM